MPPRDMIEIANGELSASINPFGAELTHLRDAGGRELMTDADPAFWTGHAPILFPIVGALHDDTLRVDGQDYTLGKHGFARRSLFELVAQHPQRAAFSLVDSEETRAHYPFAFQLDLAFELERTTLGVTATITNRDDKPMPTSFGFHPAFAWPLPYGEDRAAHRITFAADEPGSIKEITTAGLVMPQERASPLDDARVLRLRDELFEHDALIWDPVHAQAVTYGASQGPRLRVAFPDTPRLGIWTKPGAHYVCIEPWHGIADPDGFTGAFADKPGVFTLAPGAQKRIGMSITLER